jgi:hypothetical protein
MPSVAASSLIKWSIPSMVQVQVKDDAPLVDPSVVTAPPSLSVDGCQWCVKDGQPVVVEWGLGALFQPP